MTDDDLFELSRRKALAGLGTIGAASAGAGLGTSAFFSDTESFDGNQLTAGELDLKVGWEEHYSDWSEDEDTDLSGSVDMVAGTDGSTADLSDDTRVGLPADVAALIAVQDNVDAKQFLDNTQEDQYPSGYDSDNFSTGSTIDCDGTYDLADDDGSPPVIDLDDVKPGDFGEVTFSFAICDNPGYVWAQAFLESKSEGDVTEPEGKDDDEKSGVVELLDEVQVAFWLDDGNNFQNGGEQPLFVGSLRDVINGDVPAIDGTGVRIDGRNIPHGSTTPGANVDLTAVGVNRFDVNTDGNYDVDFDLVEDPSSENRGKVAHATSGGSQTQDYASSVVSVGYRIDELDTLQYDYYEGENNTNANPDEVILLLQESDGTQHVVFRNGGSANDGTTENSWQTRDIYSELTSSVGGWTEIADDGSLNSISEPASEYGTDTTIVSMGAGVGNTSGGSGSVSDIYVDRPVVGGSEETPDGPISFQTIIGPFPTACFRGNGTVYNGVFAWWLPVDHANEIQDDSATFTLGLYTEQCRHNDGSGDPPAPDGS